MNLLVVFEQYLSEIRVCVHGLGFVKFLFLTRARDLRFNDQLVLGHTHPFYPVTLMHVCMYVFA